MKHQRSYRIMALVLMSGLMAPWAHGLSHDSVPSTGAEVDILPLEGDSNHVSYFLLEIAGTFTHAISVDYTTRDGSAMAGKDYVATSGTAVIEAGETAVAIGVEILGDTLPENGETFYLVISNPQGASFPDGITEIKSHKTIRDDDLADADDGPFDPDTLNDTTDSPILVGEDRDVEADTLSDNTSNATVVAVGEVLDVEHHDTESRETDEEVSVGENLDADNDSSGTDSGPVVEVGELLDADA